MVFFLVLMDIKLACRCRRTTTAMILDALDRTYLAERGLLRDRASQSI